MGSRGDSGGSDTADEKKQDSYAKQFKKDYKVTKRGGVKKKNILDKIVDNSLLLNNPITRKTEQVNRDFFENKVKRNTNKFSNYEDYITARGRGEVDAYGNTIQRNDNDGGNDRPSQKSAEQPKTATQMDNTGVKSDMIIADKTAPTSAEITDDEYSLDTKKRGRKKTIMTSVTGDDTPATLSKKTLLGG